MKFKFNVGDEVYSKGYNKMVTIESRKISQSGRHNHYGLVCGGATYEEDLSMEENMEFKELVDDLKEIVHADQVSAPSHYANRKYQTILVMEDQMTPEMFKGYLLGNTTKYLSRAGQKDETLQDLCKAAVYLQWLIEMEGKGKLQDVPSYGG